jgi:hypothetical protein
MLWLITHGTNINELEQLSKIQMFKKKASITMLFDLNLLTTVFFTEAINTTFCIHDILFTSEERV